MDPAWGSSDPTFRALVVIDQDSHFVDGSHRLKPPGGRLRDLIGKRIMDAAEMGAELLAYDMMSGADLAP